MSGIQHYYRSFRNCPVTMGFALLTLWTVSSCKGDIRKVEQAHNDKSITDSVVTYNQGVVKAENQEIEDYKSRHRLRMDVTPTGLQYLVYRYGTGRKVKTGDRVQIQYSVGLLTGETLYSTSPDSGYMFQTGKGHVINGLEEGILLLKEGDEAKLIIPSHLAFGLLGDLDRIPNQAVLVYDLTLTRIIPANQDHK